MHKIQEPGWLGEVSPPQKINREATRSSTGRPSLSSEDEPPLLPQCHERRCQRSRERDGHIDPSQAVLRRPLAERHGSEQVVPNTQNFSVIAVVTGSIGRVVNGVKDRTDENPIESSIAPLQVGVLHALEPELHDIRRRPIPEWQSENHEGDEEHNIRHQLLNEVIAEGCNEGELGLGVVDLVEFPQNRIVVVPTVNPVSSSVCKQPIDNKAYRAWYVVQQPKLPGGQEQRYCRRQRNIDQEVINAAVVENPVHHVRAEISRPIAAYISAAHPFSEKNQDE